MAFAKFSDRSGALWLVDVDGVRHLIRSYLRSAAVLRRSTLSPQTQALGPLNTFKLTTFTVQTNFPGLAHDINTHSTTEFNTFKAMLKISGQKAFDYLVAKRNETINNSEAFREMQQEASRQTNDAINRVQNYIQTWKTGATVVRDLSADILIIGATFLSGGTAAAALGGDSVMKGGFKFEDKKLAGDTTGDALVAGSIEASTDLVVGAVQMGSASVVKTAFTAGTAEAKTAAGVLVVVGAEIDGATEFAKAAIDGKSVRQGLIAAGTRAGLDIVAGPLLDRAFPSESLSRMSFPITISRSTTQTVSLTALAVKSAASYSEDALVSLVSEDPTRKAAADPNKNAAAWHNSLACTYLPLGDSDLAYIRHFAMKRAK